MTIEAMKLALEALKFGLHVGFDESSESQIKKGGKAFDQHSKAITALRTAIEEAEKQEPRCAVIVEVFGKDWRLDYMSLPVGKHRLYTQEYVYTTPPAAQRKPLTDERVWELAANCLDSVAGRIQFARAIEAAHGITGEKPDAA
jgi:hypothetical protein